MGYRNNRMDSCSDGYRAQGCRSGQAGLVWIGALCVVLLASAGPALGQYTVQPMKVVVPVRPGKLVKSVLEIKSLDPIETHTIDLTVVDLTQSVDSNWQIIEPNSGFDLSTISSCREGVILDPTFVVLGPQEMRTVTLTLRVPRGTRGFSCAGIVASIRPREGEINTFILRFMVPVLLEIQGRPTRNVVVATDLTMRSVPAGPLGPATTVLSMNVENKGGSFPRCRPVARVWSWSGGHWRTITTTAFQDKSDDTGIIPGAKIVIETDLKKSLPPGKYKIAGVLYVDGRRTKRIEKIIDFAGDPSVTKVAADTPLDLIPKEVTVESMPGATRTTTLKVYNGSDETVEIQATLALPRDLGIKVVNDVKGVDLDCSKWVTIDPARFTLRGEAALQIVRVTASMPESATVHPCYYSNLDFWAYYPDGQRAGLTRANIYVRNMKVAAQPSAAAGKLTPHPVSGSKYQIVAQFINNGIVHFEPINCRVAVNTMISTIPRAGVKLKSGVPGAMLPGEERTFSGILDFSTLDAEVYRLSAAIEYAPGMWASTQMAIEVSIEGDQRIVKIIGTQEELPEILEIKW